MVKFANLEEYLDYVGTFVNSAFGQRYRRQFRDVRGTAELALLASPSEEEYRDLQNAVAVMTEEQKHHPEDLTGEQIQEIAKKAQADCGTVGIFINGYVLACKKA
ncbi:MAG: hypothetical protein BWY71_01057 [Planctomycetes bacterium ADurb.Bin412]|nr:MAG: hypothetical protein BWY71_01057 [Planctomycetes bacterium ADurb.Bin412]